MIKIAIERPITVFAFVILIVLFGLIALQRVPIQLAPDINRPILSVETVWPGASPVEVERELINPQEDILRGLEGLEEMSSRSRENIGEITLEFDVDQNMDRALLLVSNRLNRLTDYPEEADTPRLDTSGSEDSAIAWFVITHLNDNPRPIWTYGDFVEDVVRDTLERVEGVSRINVFGGVEEEMQIIVDPERMARYGLTIRSIVQALNAANISITAGSIEESKRFYTVRTQGNFENVQNVADVVLHTSPSSGRITVSDIAEVRLGYKEENARIRRFGTEIIAFNIVRETGANVIETMAGVQAAIQSLNQETLPEIGLTIEKVYDETVYINSAIQLVQNNIFIGGSLAALILFLFLRSLQATLIVSMAIPVSVVGTFVAMAFFGRSLNVISLAGIAFAVGMVVDAAIVVLDNIDRLRREGMSSFKAAYEGTSQVWAAVLVSALTTVMVFIPILITGLEIGQLFRDIAVAISVSVCLSLFVAMTLISTLSARLFRSERYLQRPSVPLIDPIARGFSTFFLFQTKILSKFRPLGLTIVLVITVGAGAIGYFFLPKLEYLPEGNRNFVFGVILPPPGYNLETNQGIGLRIEEESRPYWESSPDPSPDPSVPRIKQFFFAALRGFNFIGASAVEETRVAELIPLLTRPIFYEPGTFGFVTQPSIFGRGIGGGRSIDLDILGNSLDDVLSVALQVTGLTSQALPREQGNQFRPIPGLELGAPEIRLLPDNIRLADSGLSAAELGQTIDTYNDGLRVAEITVDGKRMDLTLKGPDSYIQQTQEIETIPIVTPSETIIPAKALADIILTSGPTEILHKDRVRTITLEVRPASDIPLEVALETLQTQVIDVLKERGLPEGIRLRMSGTADQLSQTWDSLLSDLLLSLIIVYLVMAILFESFWYPLVILFSVPVATAGGVLGLIFIQYPSLDMLTVLGFVILIGIVVNNAILLVDRALFLARNTSLSISDSILEATRNRIRPIFMSTATSLFGMLPLVIFPGAGSELYRGLGSVVVGGLAFSALLTLTLIPPLLSVLMPLLEKKTASETVGFSKPEQVVK